MGGGFGRRLPGFFNFLDYAVRTAMAMPGTPVKLDLLARTGHAARLLPPERDEPFPRGARHKRNARGVGERLHDGRQRGHRSPHRLGVANQDIGIAKVRDAYSHGAVAQRGGVMARLLHRVVRRRTRACREDRPRRLSFEAPGGQAAARGSGAPGGGKSRMGHAASGRKSPRHCDVREFRDDRRPCRGGRGGGGRQR